MTMEIDYAGLGVAFLTRGKLDYFLDLTTGDVPGFYPAGRPEDADHLAACLAEPARFLPVPSETPEINMGDRRAFIRTVDAEAVAEALRDSFKKDDPQLAFREALGVGADLERRWFRFKEARIRTRVEAWLASNGLPPFPLSARLVIVPRWRVLAWQAGGILDLLLATALMTDQGRIALSWSLTFFHPATSDVSPPRFPDSAVSDLFIGGFSALLTVMGVALLLAGRRPIERRWLPPLDGIARLAFAGLILFMVDGHRLSPAFLVVALMDVAFGLLYLDLAALRNPTSGRE